MLKQTVHPTTRLVVWLLILLAVQSLSGKTLLIAILVLPVFGVKVLRRGGSLVWRARWLLISLFVIFSWGVAGEPLWSVGFAPTYEGLAEAFTHLGRLLLVLTGIAAILENMPFSDLLAATHTLLQPLRRLGLDPDRGVVRLMLVVRYVEALPRPRDWRHLLNLPESSVSEELEVSHQPLGWIDGLIGVAALGAVMIFFYY
jgi:energy-coupling factor transporter transmembrane protein EcfT